MTKPRFAVLLEDCENGQHGNLSYVSYFLQDENDTSLSNWKGTFFFPNGAAIEFSVQCDQKYPDAVPTITFNQRLRTNGNISFMGNIVCESQN